MAADAAIKPRRHDLFCSSVTDFILRCQLCFVLLPIVRPVALMVVYFPLRCSLVFDLSALLLCATAQRCRLSEDWVGRAYTFPYHGPTPLQSGPTAVDLPTLTGSRPQASRGCVYLLTPIHACPKRSMAVFLCFPGAAGQGERTCADPVCQDDQQVIHGQPVQWG